MSLAVGISVEGVYLDILASRWAWLVCGVVVVGERTSRKLVVATGRKLIGRDCTRVRAWHPTTVLQRHSHYPTMRCTPTKGRDSWQSIEGHSRLGLPHLSYITSSFSLFVGEHFVKSLPKSAPHQPSVDKKAQMRVSKAVSLLVLIAGFKGISNSSWSQTRLFHELLG